MKTKKRNVQKKVSHNDYLISTRTEMGPEEMDPRKIWASHSGVRGSGSSGLREERKDKSNETRGAAIFCPGPGSAPL